MNGMAMMTKEIIERMRSVEAKIEEINTTQDHTKQTMDMGFADMERSFEAAHTYNKDHFRMLEDDIKG
eukprot:5638474-Heterocapsa_arctica.AAC.1